MISVVIPSFNSENTISTCLSALENQSYKDDYEIILVDSSTDRTPEIVKEHFTAIKFVHFDRKTDPGTARNWGIKHSIGEVILFIDSDCRAEVDWIKKLVAWHQKYPDMAAVGGAAVNGSPYNNAIAWAGYMGEFREFIPQQQRGFVTHIPTLNISYKRWVFEKNGVFDTQYYPQEDLVFNYYLTSKGYKIFFDPDIIVEHTHREDLNSFLIHQMNIGRITARVLKIIPLQGAGIARNKFLFILLGPLLPLLKFAKTIAIFLQKNPRVLLSKPLSIFLLKIGLLYWFRGFINGVFEKSNLSQPPQ